MHFIMDILIQRQEFEKTGMEERLANWGGELLSYDPPKYSYKSSLVFHRNMDMSYYTRFHFLKDRLNVYDYIALTIESDQLRELDKLIYHKEQNIYTNELILFIDRMLDILKEFCIINLLEGEDIEETYAVHNSSEAIHILIESLQRNCPKGVIIIKNE